MWCYVWCLPCHLIAAIKAYRWSHANLCLVGCFLTCTAERWFIHRQEQCTLKANLLWISNLLFHSCELFLQSYSSLVPVCVSKCADGREGLHISVAQHVKLPLCCCSQWCKHRRSINRGYFKDFSRDTLSSISSHQSQMNHFLRVLLYFSDSYFSQF